MAELVPVTRPNGKVYRPRKPPRAVPVEDDRDGSTVYVLGTHDVERARALAQRVTTVCPYPRAESWHRLGMRNGDPYYVYDDVRGAPSLVFVEE